MAILQKKKGFFGRMAERIGDVILAHNTVDEDMMDELEEVLITSDIGMETTEKIMEDLRQHIKKDYIQAPERVKKKLTEIIAELMDKGDRLKLSSKSPLVIMMIGINGGGKTTTIAKLGNRLKQ